MPFKVWEPAIKRQGFETRSKRLLQKHASQHFAWGLSLDFASSETTTSDMRKRKHAIHAQFMMWRRKKGVILHE